jgi:hypothetical protein
MTAYRGASFLSFSGTGNSYRVALMAAERADCRVRDASFLPYR